MLVPGGGCDPAGTMAKPFQGVINLDIRDATPDWTPYLADRAPQGHPMS